MKAAQGPKHAGVKSDTETETRSYSPEDLQVNIDDYLSSESEEMATLEE